MPQARPYPGAGRAAWQRRALLASAGHHRRPNRSGGRDLRTRLGGSGRQPLIFRTLGTFLQISALRVVRSQFYERWRTAMTSVFDRDDILFQVVSTTKSSI